MEQFLSNEIGTNVKTDKREILKSFPLFSIDFDSYKRGLDKYQSSLC